MSFRARLTIFFLVIVVIPMSAMGLLVFGLIDGSAQSKSDARAAGIADTAIRVYDDDGRQASLQARLVARELALTPPSQLPARSRALARRLGLARVVVRVGTSTASDVGDAGAVAPGVAVTDARAGAPRRTFTVSRETAGEFARALAGTETIVVVRQGTRVLAASRPDARGARLPAGRGAATVGGARYEVISESVDGFGTLPLSVAVLSAQAATADSAADDRVFAIVVMAVALALALAFAMIVSRGLQAQVAHFLQAARRLGGGDFSSPVPTVGRDAFAELGEEFNSMSRQLQGRLGDLEQERRRLRTSIKRIGEAFASGLDRDALLKIALRTAMDATESDRGRVIGRMQSSGPLLESHHVGRLAGLATPLGEAERRAIEQGGIGEASAGSAHVVSVALGLMQEGGPAHGVISVSREGSRFSDDDLDLLRSLALRASDALDNVDMHDDVARQAITDDLTGLASHGHFEELLEKEMSLSARYDYPVAIAMFDLDNFKSVNDTYGHQQGDLVLRRVSDVLRETCRDSDVSARYGGEEMVLILPHTDLDGAFTIAERARAAIEGLGIPRVDHQGWLRITTSVGVAASRDGRTDTLVAAADGALYAAKRSGKNRTERAAAPNDARELARSAEPVGGE